MKRAKTEPEDEMLGEYDFRRGVRGKYCERFAAGSNVVVLSPDVAEVFTDSDSVNRALRVLIQAAREYPRRAPSQDRALREKPDPVPDEG